MRIELRAGGWWGLAGLLGLLLLVCGEAGLAQGVTTTTVQGTVYLANGAPGSGTLLVSWPAFTTTTNLAVAAGKATVTIGSDGFVSVNLAPNLGANPAGLYYTAVFHLSDGTVNTEYWVIPAAATASLAQVRARLMPAAQAVQTVNLIGTMRGVLMSSLGTGWVTSVAPGTDLATGLSTGASRRIGAVADSSECYLTGRSGGSGSLVFYMGLAPALGEIIAVQYRTRGRAVGRAVNEASQAALVAAGAPAVAVWAGSVTEPVARSSYDCRNAATALVAAASSVSATWSGTYKSTNLGLGLVAGADIWPGDALEIEAPSLGLDVQVVVRSVTLRYGATVPDVVEYSIAFSNDWANDLAIRSSRTVPEDAWLPAAVSPTYLANLNGLTVTGISSTAVSVQANVTPPVGGGFEVRRRDFSFQAGTDTDLVMRSGVANFDIPRATEADRFYVRMYDGGGLEGGPPNYSEFSVGLFVNLPLSV